MRNYEGFKGITRIYYCFNGVYTIFYCLSDSFIDRYWLVSSRKRQPFFMGCEVKVYLRHKDGVVQEHHVSKRKIGWFERLIDRTHIKKRCGVCGLRGCEHEFT